MFQMKEKELKIKLIQNVLEFLRQRNQKKIKYQKGQQGYRSSMRPSSPDQTFLFHIF